MTVGFSRLQLSGYRRLRNLDLELRPLDVLIGASGVGKSSVLEALCLFAASADGELSNAISKAGSLWNIVTSDEKTGVIGFRVEARAESKEPISYEIELSFAGIGHVVRRARRGSCHSGPTSRRWPAATARGRARFLNRSITTSPRPTISPSSSAQAAKGATACPELKAFLNTILKLAGGTPL